MVCRHNLFRNFYRTAVIAVSGFIVLTAVAADCAGTLKADPFNRAVALYDFKGDLKDVGGQYRSDGKVVGKSSFTAANVPAAGGTSPGADGSALLLPGDMYIDLGEGDNGELHATGAFSLFARVKIKAPAGTIISKRGNAGKTFHLGIQPGQSGDTCKVWFALTSAGTDFYGSGAKRGDYILYTEPVPLHTWFDVAAVFEPGKRLELYVDGEPVDSVPAGKIPGQVRESTVPVIIGAQPYAANNSPVSSYMNGQIEKICLWTEALPAAEIGAISCRAGLSSLPAAEQQPAAEAAVPVDATGTVGLVDEAFTGDLFLPVMELSRGTKAWSVDEALMERAFIKGDCSIDKETLLGGVPALRFRPGTARAATIQWYQPVEEGRLYRFSAAYRSSGRKKDDPSSYLAPTGSLSLAWLDADGGYIPVRDMLRSRSSSESAWVRNEVTGLTPPGARRALLTCTVSSYEVREGDVGWFGDIKWEPVQLSPVDLTVSPRVLRSPGEAFTIRLSRSHLISLACDGSVLVELLDSDKKVQRKWEFMPMLTLPWSTTVHLPDTVKAGTEWYVKVKLNPMRKYPGSVSWEWTEPVCVTESHDESRLAGGRFVVNGRKRFLIGSAAQPEDYRLLKEAGFNCITFKQYNPAEAAKALDAVREAGLAAICSIGGGYQARGNQVRVEGLIRSVKDHPALLMWMLSDEPTRNGLGPRELSRFSWWAKNIAPGVPVGVNDTTPSQFQRYVSSTDVFFADPYPLLKTAIAEPAMDMVKRWLCLVRDLTPEDRAYVGYVDAYRASNKRAPAPAELKNEVYQVVASGAAGVYYYSVRVNPWYLPSEPLFNTVKEINAGIRAIEEWLVTKPLGKAPLKFGRRENDTLMSTTWVNDQGTYLSMLINLERTEQTADISIDESYAGKHYRLTDGRELPEKITLKPLEVVSLQYK